MVVNPTGSIREWLIQRKGGLHKHHRPPGDLPWQAGPAGGMEPEVLG